MPILSDNPLLKREIRGRIRFRKFGANRMNLWVSGFVALVVLYFYGRALAAIGKGQAADARDFWAALVYGLLFLIVLLAPSLTANAVTQEREQQTWDTLATTRLTAGEVLLGKWLARQVPLMLVLVVALPLLLGCAVRGQIHPITTVLALLFLILTSGLFGVIGLLCSFLAKRTALATASALTLTAFLCLGTLIVDSLYRSLITLISHSSYGEPTILLWCNPFFALSCLLRLIEPTHNEIFATGDHAPLSQVALFYFVGGSAAILGCLSLMIVRYRRAVQER